MIQLRLEPEIEAQLVAEAQAKGLALDQYIIMKLAELRPVERVPQQPLGDAVDSSWHPRKGNEPDGLDIKKWLHLSP